MPAGCRKTGFQALLLNFLQQQPQVIDDRVGSGFEKPVGMAGRAMRSADKTNYLHPRGTGGRNTGDAVFDNQAFRSFHPESPGRILKQIGVGFSAVNKGC